MTTSDVSGSTGLMSSARDRIVDAAYKLLTRRGIRAVGMNEIIDRASVARATLYRHFASKDDLVLAVLDHREQLWTHDLLEAQSQRRADTPEEQLLAIFEVLHDWFQRGDFDSCSFTSVLLEMGPGHLLGQACIAHLKNLRTIVRQRAEAAGLLDADNFSHSTLILMKGAIIAATEGDVEAAHRAKAMVRTLIEQHRPSKL